MTQLRLRQPGQGQRALLKALWLRRRPLLHLLSLSPGSVHSFVQLLADIEAALMSRTLCCPSQLCTLTAWYFFYLCKVQIEGFSPAVCTSCVVLNDKISVQRESPSMNTLPAACR